MRSDSLTTTTQSYPPGRGCRRQSEPVCLYCRRSECRGQLISASAPLDPHLVNKLTCGVKTFLFHLARDPRWKMPCVLPQKCVHPVGDADGDVTGTSVGHFRLSLCRVCLGAHNQSPLYSFKHTYKHTEKHLHVNRTCRTKHRRSQLKAGMKELLKPSRMDKQIFTCMRMQVETKK